LRLFAHRPGGVVCSLKKGAALPRQAIPIRNDIVNLYSEQRLFLD
jgi:hypothetical protein